VISSDCEIRLGQLMQDIDRDQWNALAAGSGPFLQHEFLHALEQSGSVHPLTGWQPFHLTVHQQDRIIAAIPLYLKQHSYGEYVFDWSWADAYRRYGQNYYPKLLTAIPFTPSQGSRLLCENPADRESLTELISQRVQDHASKSAISSWHILFPDRQDSAALSQTNLIRREGCQYHWRNRGYGSFDDFLAACSSRKRKNLRKERQDVREQGIEFERIEAGRITQEIWDIFYRFYQSTYEIRGQQGYLKQAFFENVALTMPENLFLVMARKNGDYVAGALFFRDQNALYGRYWGCAADYNNLHFETCYYQGIDYCIENRLALFDAGAQGEHKLRRGFEPVQTLSFHWINDPAFRGAIRDFCDEESVYMTEYRQQAEQHLPYRQSGVVDNKLA
tara:strand:+ start:136654 stop:137826 length:1173 start_codon:yes stop_codon:yes gene_type:complete